jgi:hypothetical protein
LTSLTVGLGTALAGGEAKIADPARARGTRTPA